MTFKEQYKGATVYVKAIDANIRVVEENIETLLKLAPYVFEDKPSAKEAPKKFNGLKNDKDDSNQ